MSDEKQNAEQYMWYDPLFKGLRMCAYTEKKEGKECSFTIWLPFEGLLDLERVKKNKKNPRNLGIVLWHLEREEQGFSFWIHIKITWGPFPSQRPWPLPELNIPEPALGVGPSLDGTSGLRCF